MKRPPRNAPPPPVTLAGVFSPPPAPEEEPELPQLKAARERDRLARERVGRDEQVIATDADKLDMRAWRKSRGWRD